MPLFCNPLLVRLAGLIPRSVGQLILLVLFCLLAGDLLTSLAALLQLNTSLKEPSELSLRLRRLTDHLDNAVTRYIQRRMARAYGLRRERLEEHDA